jgi:hypothetical protein
MPWCSRTSRCGTSWPSSSAPLRVHACDPPIGFVGPAVPPVARLGGGRRHRPTRDRHPVAAHWLQARLDLEESAARARPAVAQEVRALIRRMAEANPAGMGSRHRRWAGRHEGEGP